MSIVINTTQIKIRGYFDDLCEYAGFDTERADEVWMAILSDQEIYQELIYITWNTIHFLTR